VTWFVFFYEKVNFNFISLDKKKKPFFLAFSFYSFYGFMEFLIFFDYVDKECGKLILK